MKDELDGSAGEATYDPLMACHWMIANQAIEYLGVGLLVGDFCPICEVVRAHPDPCPQGCTDADVETWLIEGPADAALEHVKATPVLMAILGGDT